jgi:hypothetical protein
MALNDLTDQNIQDTYQKVVQTDGTNLADGTGSLLPISFDGNNVTISGSLTANEYIISSSVTNITIATLSGSTNFGDDIDDTHTFVGNISASHTGSHYFGGVTIGGQGTINGSQILTTVVRSPEATNNYIQFLGSSDRMIFVNAGHTFIESKNGKTLFPTHPIEAASSISASSFIAHTHITASGNLLVQGTYDGNITASGNISSSAAGTVSAGSGSFHVLKGDTTAATGLEVSGYISATNITASGDISASGTLIGGALQVTPTDTSEDTNHYVTFQKNGNNLTNVTNGFSFNPNTDRLTIGGLTHIEGSTGNITASGNISASGQLYANGVYNSGAYRLEDAEGTFRHVLTNGSDDLTVEIGNANMTSGVSLVGNVTASGNISSSGTIEGSSISSDAAYYAGGYRVIYNLGNDVYLGYSGGNQTAVIQGSNITLDAPVTASIISASGNVTADKIYLQNEVNPLGNYLEWDGTGLHYKGSSHINGNITASGNISASGDLIATGVRLPSAGIISFDDSLDGTDQFIKGTDNNIQIDGDDYVKVIIDDEFWVGPASNNGKFKINADGEIITPITASGDISASGHIEGKIKAQYITGSHTTIGTTATGDILKFGDVGTTPGHVYVLKDGIWSNTDADATNTSTGSLAVAVGTNSTTHGMLLRGMVKLDHSTSANIGSPIYLSTTPNELQKSPPTDSGETVRVCGYQISGSGTGDTIFFTPDNTWVTLS